MSSSTMSSATLWIPSTPPRSSDIMFPNTPPRSSDLKFPDTPPRSSDIKFSNTRWAPLAANIWSYNFTPRSDNLEWASNWDDFNWSFDKNCTKVDPPPPRTPDALSQELDEVSTLWNWDDSSDVASLNADTGELSEELQGLDYDALSKDTILSCLSGILDDDDMEYTTNELRGVWDV